MRGKSLFRNYVEAHFIRYLIGASLLLASLLCQLYIPVILKNVTDALQRMSIDGEAVLRFAGALVLAGLCMAVLQGASRIWLFQMARKLESEIRARLFAHWARLSPEYYGRQRIGDLMAHAVNDVNIMRELAMAGVYQAIESVLLIVIAVVIMSTYVDAGLTLWTALPLPLLALMTYLFHARISRQSTEVQEAYGSLASKAQQFIAGIRVIKACAQEREERDKFTAVNEINRCKHVNLTRTNAQFTSLGIGLVGVSYLISVVVGGTFVMRGAITLGEFVAFNTYLTFIIQPVENLGKVVSTFQRAMAADARLSRILRTEPAIADAGSVLPAVRPEGGIAVRGLTFAYPDGDEPVLKDIDLEVPAGGSLAIVGKVGSGKSTLVSLLLRAYNPPEGTVFVGGRDILRLPLGTLRASVGYVPQDIFLFSGTIADNIAFDPRPHTADRIHDAARQAEVYDNIAAFPGRFDTRLGERGISLSGGQRQRISIARAIIKEAPILILDDSLSAVDAETEELILANLKTAASGKTVILVSHRISTIRHADQIVVMDEGRIVERGTHGQLIAQGGIYANMAMRQRMDRDMERVEAGLDSGGGEAEIGRAETGKAEIGGV